MQEKCQVIRYSHFFIVKNPTRAMYPVLYGYASEFTIQNYVWDPVKRRKTWVPDKTYALYVDGGQEFRFHIGQWVELIDRAFRNYIDPRSYEIVDAPMYDPPDVGWATREGWELLPEQVDASNFILESYRNGQRMPQISMPTGTGKFQRIDTPVKVPGGWRLIGDLRPGDTVTAWDGTPSMVVRVFPQGVKPLYRITFSDGRSTNAGGEHLWRVYKAEWGRPPRTPGNIPVNPRVVDTNEIIRLLSLKTGPGRLSVDLCQSEFCADDQDFELDPYLLGLLLGDGGFSQNGVSFHKPDVELHEAISKLLPEGVVVKQLSWKSVGLRGAGGANELRRILKRLGLTGCRSWEKFIPEDYLHGSNSQRLALLQGLMDTDGYIDPNSSTSYCTTSEKLAKQVRYLVRSLGGIATIAVKKNAAYTYKGEKRVGRWAYIVFIRHKKPSELFRLKRKKDRANDAHQYVEGLKLGIRSVEPMEPAECVCIEIDHPDHLYVTNDFIVTHNTVTALMTAATVNKRIAVPVLAGYVDKWIGDISEILEIEDSEIGKIKGGKALLDASHWPSSGEPVPKALVFSLDTMQTWYDLYEQNTQDPKLEAYGCKPWEFWEHLGVGTLIFDEMHQHLYKIFRANAYTHAPLSINLSATLMSKDPVKRRIQMVMFPKTIRFEKVKMKRYIHLHALGYQIIDFAGSHVRTSERGSNTYSHNAYELSIMGNKYLLQQYVKMITDSVQQRFMDIKIAGDKCIVYVARKKFARLMCDRLRELYPHLTVNTFIEGEPQSHIKESDICVTTLISGSTAHDVKGLRVVIMTTSVDSPISNLQALGRLREMKQRVENNDVHFYYLYCSSVSKHVDYHKAKIELFADRVASFTEESIATLLPRRNQGLV